MADWKDIYESNKTIAQDAIKAVTVAVASNDGSIARKIVAHPTIAGIFTRPGRLLPSYIKMPPGSVPSEQSYEFLNPNVVGDTVFT